MRSLPPQPNKKGCLFWQPFLFVLNYSDESLRQPVDLNKYINITTSKTTLNSL